MKKSDEKKQEPRQGSVSAEDNDLMEWLHKFFHKGEPPEKIEVWQGAGALRNVRDAKIHHIDFKPNDTKNQEDCARMANEILALAQHDCNTVGKKSTYIIDVTDRHRTAEPITRKFGPLLPKLASMVRRGQDPSTADDDENELVIGPKPMLLHLLDRLLAVTERREQALNAITGDIMLHQSRENAELRTNQSRLMESNMRMFFAFQDAEDRKEDRADRRQDRMVARARDELIADGMREGGRLIRNLLPRVVDTFSGESSPEPQRVAMQPASPGGQPALPDYGPSRERYLVENFLRDIDDAKNAEGQSAQLDVKLFGDWIETPDGMKPDPDPAKAGIFTPDQFRVLFGVAKGWLHPDRIDELMPDWGHANAISGEQIMQAQSLVPQSAMIAVFELLGLRTKKREAATTANAAA